MRKQQFVQKLQMITRRMLLAVGLSACVGLASAAGAGSDSWQEEVLLHDGRTIVVDRSQTYGGGHEIGQRSPIKVLSVSFRLPSSSKQFTWTSSYHEASQIANLKLASLHVLVGHTVSCRTA